MVIRSLIIRMLTRWAWLAIVAGASISVFAGGPSLNDRSCKLDVSIAIHPAVGAGIRYEADQSPSFSDRDDGDPAISSRQLSPPMLSAAGTVSNPESQPHRTPHGYLFVARAPPVPSPFA